MKKFLKFTLLITVSLSAISHIAGANNTSGEYKLDEQKAADYQLEKSTDKTVEDNLLAKEKIEEAKSQIITEKTPTGHIEKLLDNTGKVIAKKTIENDKVIEKVLNYYHPNGKLSRQITADDRGSFYAEEFYNNGAIASQTAYLSDGNKIGKEKKYDATGVLRQEINWQVIDEDKNKPQQERRTKPTGIVTTYYPDGRIAATFPADGRGDTIFYNQKGNVVKKVSNAKIIKFTDELNKEDCTGKSIKLSLEELVELYEDEGDISYNKCGLPYREIFVYEIDEVIGKIATKVSFDTEGMVRRIATYKDGQKDGIEQKFDASGNLIAEINYKEGKKEGYAKGYFPTKELAFRKEYKNGKVEGNLNCYYPTGEIAATFNYKDGKKQGTAEVYGVNARKIEFKDDEIVGKKVDETRNLATKLSSLENIGNKCLDISNKKDELLLELEANENTINKILSVKIPYNCEDVEKYTRKNSRLICYNNLNEVRVSIPANYRRGWFVKGIIFGPNKKVEYDTAYYKKQLQGWTKKYDINGNHIADIYFNNGKQDETSRSYHPNGAVKDMISIVDNGKRKGLSRYSQTNDLEFSLSYKDDKKLQAYLTDKAKNKNINIHFYDGKLDNIREFNATNPSNFIEYDLALGEYLVYKDKKLIKGGKICGYPQTQTKTTTEEQNKQSNLETKEDTSSLKAKLPVVIPSQEIKEEISTTNIEDKKQIINNNSKDEEIIIPEIEEKTVSSNISSSEIKEYNIENAIIPSNKDKKQAELAAQNIGPISKPEISNLTDTVDKTTKETNNEDNKENAENQIKTQKLYYPNGNIRKTIKTEGSRTREVKEYSKTGLMLTDTIYDDKDILIEKYYGSGKIRSKTKKNYTDNAIMSFVSREDFYENGNKRYYVERIDNKLLFNENTYYPTGELKTQTMQNSPVSFITKEYDKNGNLAKETETFANTTLIKNYDEDKTLISLTLNGKDVPISLAKDDKKMLEDGAKTYNNKSELQSEVKIKNNKTILVEYYSPNKIKSEITFFDNGEIDAKQYSKSGELEKYARLTHDGKLLLQKPEIRTIPSYRERYWVDYNNPNWVENKDRYSIKSIGRLYLDTTAYMMADLGMEVPDSIKKLYEIY